MYQRNFLRKSKGFTLIELLVVISIIGLLTSVVLASVRSARIKAADAAIVSNMESAQVQAAIYFSNNSSRYGTEGPTDEPFTCANNDDPVAMFGNSSDGIYKQLNGALQRSGSTMFDALCFSSEGANPSYVIAVPLASNTSDGQARYWCIDSSGNSKCVPTENGCDPLDNIAQFNFPTDGVTPASCSDYDY